MHNRHASFRLKINLVVETYNQKKMISKAIEHRLLEIINKNFLKQNIKLEGHKFINKNTLFMTFFISPHTFALSKVVNSLKTSTSRLIQKEFAFELNSFNVNEGFWEQEYKIYT